MSKYLVKSVQSYEGLEALRVRSQIVVLSSDEVTSNCPVTGQPDWYEVTISIEGGYSIESKSLKLFFWSLRDQGIFCEDLAGRILDEVTSTFIKAKIYDACIEVRIKQKSRGGISIIANCSTVSAR